MFREYGMVLLRNVTSLMAATLSCTLLVTVVSDDRIVSKLPME